MTTATAVVVPRADGALERVTLGTLPPVPVVPHHPATSRLALAAAHVVADPRVDVDPRSGAAVDWDATIRFRHHLWTLGFGVAEAMDTAQRGMGITYPVVRELIERSAAAAPADRDALVCGVSTDQLPPEPQPLDAVTEAYLVQLEHVEGLGARAVLMCSRHLVAVAAGPDDFHAVYGRVISAAKRPVILHWLGPMFDPALRGYWGHEDVGRAMDEVLGLVAAHAERIDGVKISLLDADLEVAFRRRLPAGVRCYTGDDFNFPELIGGDEEGHSDALLGIFDPIAAVAAAALARLDAGDRAGFDALLAPTVPLSHHLFAAPTFHYKTGVVFLAYLAGHQDHFRMLGGHEASRSVPHLAGALLLADRAGVLPDPELAAARARAFLALAGVPQSG